MNIGYRNDVLREAKEIAKCADEEGMTREAASRLSDRYEVSFDDAAHDVARCIAAYHAMKRAHEASRAVDYCNVDCDGRYVNFELFNGVTHDAETIKTVRLTEVE